MSSHLEDYEGCKQPISTHVIPRDGQKDLRVTGIRFASASNGPDSFGGPERWKERNVFLTESGKVVYQEAGCSSFDGEHTRSEVHVFENFNSLGEHLGYSPLEKQIREMIGVEDYEDIK